MKLQSGTGWFAAAVILAAAANLSGQSAAPARQDDVLSALLVEVKGLRLAMEQMGSAGPRVQLFASRLQLQETRIGNMIRRLDTVRDRIGEAQADVARLQTEQKQVEAALDEHKSAAGAESREEVNMATLLISGVKTKLAAARATLDRLAAEEVQLVSDISSEQARWVEISGRLDELEKTLAKR